MTYEMIQTRIDADKVGVITLNRPKQLNALNEQLIELLIKRKIGRAHV